MDFIEQFAALGVKIPDLLLPAPDTDLKKWAVIACDQFTSDAGYWDGVREFVGEAPSTLNLILPEAFLDSPALDDRISAIHRTMRRYLDDGIFAESKQSLVLVERRTAYNRNRHGLMLCLDLEHYDYTGQKKSLVRPTEETIQSRIPTREKIRHGAPLEFPHILVLINDPDNRVIGPLVEAKPSLVKLYDADLMMDSGHLRGWRVRDIPLLSKIRDGLQSLIDPLQKDPFLFALGDGNHSLAAAKSVWNKVKENHDGPVPENHPARFALVEVVNLFDPGLEFEPIHRVLFGVKTRQFLSFLSSRYRVRLAEGERHFPLNGPGQVAGMLSDTFTGRLIIENPESPLVCANLQKAVDEYLRENPETKIDYVHGADTAESLGWQADNLALFLPPMRKTEFFKTIEVMGTLPRKAFSMGEATEKRFYLEGRRIL